METVTDFIFLGSVDGDCSHEMKRRLLLGRKAVTNLHSILKHTDITLSTKVCLVKVMVFPVVMYGCESWTKKKTEHGRTDALQLWCWKRLLRVQGTFCKEIKPVNPKEKSALNICWENWCRSSNTLGTWCEKPTHWRRPWCWERLKSSGEGNDRGWDGCMASLTPWTWVEQAPGDGEGHRSLVCCSPRGCTESDTTEQLTNNNS